MSWECQVHRSADQQLEGFSDLTVGEVFGLSCRGETVDNLQAEAVKLALPEESPFDYKILEIKKMAADGGEFLMTTYRAPSEGLGPLTLTDGHQQWELQIEPITVASVLPQDSAEPPLPYGPYGPFVLGWPLWLLLFAIPLILLVVWPTVILIKRVQRSRRIREVLAATKGTLTPLENFHKAQRQIVKGLHVFKMGEPEQKKEGLSKIRSTFARYLLQEFRALATSEGLTGVEKKAVLKGLQPGRARELMARLELLLREMDRAEEDAAKVDLDQAQKLVEMARELVVQLHAAQRGRRRGVA